MQLHLIRVEGTRMIEQGTDGLSRGNKLEGVLSGVKILNFVPIQESELFWETLIIDCIPTWESYP